MKSTVETLGPTRARLAVELPFEEIQPSLDRAYKAIASQIRIPGFRPGKAPQRVIDQRVGRDAVLEQAVNDALPQAYSSAIAEAGLIVVGQPDIELTNVEDRVAISFTAEVDIRPEFDLPQFDALAVTVEDAIVTDVQVEDQLNELRDRFGTLRGVQRPAQDGDYVSIDIDTRVDGEPLDGGSAAGLSYEVGSGDLMGGLDEAIIGASAGDSVTFDSKLAAGEFAGREAQVTVAVVAVKEKDLPEADDEFAQVASEFDTLEQLRADLRERLTRTVLALQGIEARNKVVDALLDAVDFPLPESLVAAEIEWRLHQAVHRLDHDEELLAGELAEQGSSREEFDAESREAAQRAVKSQLVLDSIADAEQLAVSEAELTHYLVRQSQRYGLPPQEFANQIVEAGNLPALMADVRRDKALALVLEAASVTEESGKPVELAAMVGGSGLSALADLAQLAARPGHEDDGHDHEGHDH
ncbi:MAG: trigger factor [Frankiaceae bacterium]|nr:trigger factor [Frankiaceae bacterium]